MPGPDEKKNSNTTILGRLKRMGVPVYSKSATIKPGELKGVASAPHEEVAASVAKSPVKEIKISIAERQVMDSIFEKLAKLSENHPAVKDMKDLSEEEKKAEVYKDNLFTRTLQEIAEFQRISDEASREKTVVLKEALAKKRESCETLLITLKETLKLKSSEESELLSPIIKDLKNIANRAVFTTEFDDVRLHEAKKSVKKQGGANPGYTITNAEDTRFTVKQGKSVGNTLSEAFSSMVLSRVAEASGLEDKSQVVIANAFLTVKVDEAAQDLPIEERCKKSLFAASQWSTDRGSFEACQLFGLEKRIKAAGSRQADDFKVLRDINEACNLGLEAVILPTALIADFDLHTENYMLKVNDERVPPENKGIVSHHLELLKQEMLKTDEVSSEDRVKYLIGIIKVLQEAGANVYFHKIDHDSGFYRYADPERKVDFTSHKTSPLHREGFRIKTQPTLHIVEITGGTPEGFDQLMLSEQGIKKLINLDMEKELKIVEDTAKEFFVTLHEKAEVIAGKGNEQDRMAAEFFLLNEFYYHLIERRMPTPKTMNEAELEKMKSVVLEQLKKGTVLKVTDLHEQVYKRLLEIKKQGPLTEMQDFLLTMLKGQPYLEHMTRGKENRSESAPRPQ